MSRSPLFDARTSDVAELLAQRSSLTVDFTPTEAFLAIGLLQAGCRVADVDADMRRSAHTIVDRLKHGFPAELHEIVDAGWDLSCGSGSPG